MAAPDEVNPEAGYPTLRKMFFAIAGVSAGLGLAYVCCKFYDRVMLAEDRRWTALLVVASAVLLWLGSLVRPQRAELDPPSDDPGEGYGASDPPREPPAPDPVAPPAAEPPPDHEGADF